MLSRLRLSRRDLVCQQAVELVTSYLEGSLSRAGRRRFEAHLAGCPHCTEYLAQMRATIRLTGMITADDLPEPALEEFTELYRRWRADGGDGEGGSLGGAAGDGARESLGGAGGDGAGDGGRDGGGDGGGPSA
jgi:anti-sigma factor RsiW